jgi:hypothetical protein
LKSEEKGRDNEYFKKQYRKFIILYLSDKIKTLDFEVTNKDFRELFQSYMTENSTEVDCANLDLSIKSTLTFMKELGKTNQSTLTGTLKNIHESFISTGYKLRKKRGIFD